MPTRRNNDAIVTDSTKRINAIQTHLKKANVLIPMDGELVKPAAVQAIFQRSLDARARVTSARGAYLAALKARDDVEAERLVAEDSLKSWVLNRFGAVSAEAHEFGYAARKVAEVSVETRAAAVAKNKATRAARNTRGKKERLKIKGVVPIPSLAAAPAVDAPAAAASVPSAGAPLAPPAPPAAAANGVARAS